MMANEQIDAALALCDAATGTAATTEDRPMTEPLTGVRAVHFPADDDGSPDIWQVQAGEYADEPDLVITVHGTDSEGNDIREDIARRIAATLGEDA